jgi:F0F1-type ATP synthase epsilon subunit
MANEDNLLLVRFISPSETFFEGEAKAVSANDASGPFDILPGHSSFVGLLTSGDVVIKSVEGDRSIGISRGIIHVHDNRVEVFANV